MVHHLRVCKIMVFLQATVADILGQHFSDVSSSLHYPHEFLHTKEHAEATYLDFTPNRLESYNDPISIGEMREALRRSKATAPCMDGVHYLMLRNLAPTAESLLLRIYNKCWLEGMFPERWHRALLLPFLKHNKPPQLPSSYCPIAVTSCKLICD